MHGDLRRAPRGGAWVALALIALSACSASPGANASAPSAGASAVAEEVRLATDRSALWQDAVTLPNGQRIRRLSSPNGFNHVLVARMGPDGKPVVSCVDSAPAAEAFLAGGQGAGH